MAVSMSASQSIFSIGENSGLCSGAHFPTCWADQLVWTRRSGVMLRHVSPIEVRSPPLGVWPSKWSQCMAHTRLSSCARCVRASERAQHTSRFRGVVEETSWLFKGAQEHHPEILTFCVLTPTFCAKYVLRMFWLTSQKRTTSAYLQKLRASSVRQTPHVGTFSNIFSHFPAVSLHISRILSRALQTSVGTEI